MKTFILVLLCLCTTAALGKEAVFANGVLSFDSVQVGADTYEVQLAPVPNVAPMAFTVTQARKVATTTTPAATLIGATLTVPNVLVNGTLRLRATLMLTGQNPYKFQLSSYSTVRGVELNNMGQVLTPGRLFNINYTGGVLDTSKVKLKIGTTLITSNVLNNAISATVPSGFIGNQILTAELDGDSFQLPLAISAGADIANPKLYASGYVNELAADLKSLGLPAALLNTASITTQLASLSDAEAKVVALQIRENLEPLLAQVNELLGSNTALTGTNSMYMQAMTFTSAAECKAWMKRFAVASTIAATGVYVTSAGLAYGITVPGAIITGVGLASIVVASDVALRNMKLILNYCGALNDATFSLFPLLQKDLVLTTPIEVFESRTRTFKLNELFRLDQTIRSSYVSTATSLKSTVAGAISMAGKLGFSAGSSVISSLNTLAASIKTDDTSTVSTDGHKFSIRSISDTSISGSTVDTGTGTLTLLFDKKNEDLAEGKNTSFTIELYNSVDGITITVPVKMNGASLLEDLMLAVLGNWTVQPRGREDIFQLELKAGGTGVYKLPLTADTNGFFYCPNTGPPIKGICEYSISWSISRVGSKYVLIDSGFFHPAYTDTRITDRSGLTLPVTGFTVYDIGNPDSVSIRFIKL